MIVLLMKEDRAEYLVEEKINEIVSEELGKFEIFLNEVLITDRNSESYRMKIEIMKTVHSIIKRKDETIFDNLQDSSKVT